MDEALQQLERAMQRMSTAPNMLMVYAEVAKRANRFDAARIVYQRVRAWLEQQGASEDLLRDPIEGLAEVQVHLKNYEDAVSGYSWLVERWPERKWYRYRYGVALGLSGRYQSSLEVLLKLQSDHPGLAALCTKVAFAYLQLKRDREAKQFFNEALMLDPHDAFALFHLARLQALKGRIDLAENYYLRLLEVDDAEVRSIVVSFARSRRCSHRRRVIALASELAAGSGLSLASFGSDHLWPALVEPPGINVSVRSRFWRAPHPQSAVPA